MIRTIKNAITPIRKIIYQNTGKKPWSYGYNDTRWALIKSTINNKDTIKRFAEGSIPDGFGVGFDERVVEYPWIFSRLSGNKDLRMLDAGSTFNFPEIVSHPEVADKNLTIFTYYPEPNNFVSRRISYMFGDLRQMPFADQFFDEVVCQSTIEHVDMDNSIYGYELSGNENSTKKSYDYLLVISELVRVLKPGGKLLITFPYGRFENHGFFQQFDEEMVSRITDMIKKAGHPKQEYILYSEKGWRFEEATNCNDSVSFNPHTGQGKGNDGAAHCRCVCCIEFIKS